MLVIPMFQPALGGVEVAVKPVADGVEVGLDQLDLPLQQAVLLRHSPCFPLWIKIFYNDAYLNQFLAYLVGINLLKTLLSSPLVCA